MTVDRVPLRALRLDTTKVKTAYIEEQTPDLSGLTATASYTDGRADRRFTLEEILSDPDFTIQTDTGGETDAPLKRGTHTWVVRYKYPEIAASLTLTARERRLTSLTVETPPKTDVVYSRTEVPDLTGLTLLAAYDNGTEERLTAADCGIVCEPERFVLGEGNPVTLVYGGREATVYFRYAREIPTGLSVVPPDILAFSLGEAVDLSALKVYIVYNSGRREETTDYALSAVDSRQIGAQTVTVTCGEFSNVFTIYIQEFYRLGDVSGDGKITAYDARLVLRAAVGYIHYTGRLLRAADADRDGKLTASDARLVLRAAVGLENFSEEADI